MMLTPFELWMVQQNLNDILEASPQVRAEYVADRLILLRAQGYYRVADAVEDQWEEVK